MRLILAVIVALMVSAPARAQQDDIRTVIGAQLEAFQADDVATAFTFASPVIKNMFGTAENFGLMVRRGYPMVWRPADVRFLGLETRGGQQVQRVLITDSAGNLHALDYYMVETAEGWQINGVHILPALDVGA